MLKYIKRKYHKAMDEIKTVTAMHVAASMCNQETFGPLKCINEGKEIALCGAGPSLKLYDPIKDVSHIALNRALLYDKVHYDWFIADDWEGIYFIQDELLKYDCEKFFGHQIGGELHRQIPESFRIACNAKRYYNDSYMKIDTWKSEFICDIDKMAISNMPNIALSAMQVALFSHPKRIYLVGCDSAPGHFVRPKGVDSAALERQKKDQELALLSDGVKEKWRELKVFADTFYPDVEIVSINPVGLKGIFRDEYQ